MEHDNKGSSSFVNSIDVSYMYRQVKKSIAYIVMIAIICGVLTYMWEDTHNSTTYEASVILVMVPRDNVVNKQLTSQVNAAVARSVSVLNSYSLYEQIKKDNEGTVPPGSFSAEQLTETNMIRLKAVSSSSRDALRLLREGLRAYPAVAEYMESGYLLKRLNDLSADNIVWHSERAVYKGVQVVLGIILLGVVIVLLKAYLTDKIHDLDQADELLETEVIGSLTFVKKKKGRKAIMINEDGVDISYVENIDRIATSIQREMKSSDSKTLLVTSICENEGKTTIVGNLALNLAARGYRVCLVDGDLRRPALMKIFEKGDEIAVSVSEVLEGKHELESARMVTDAGLDLYLQKKGLAEPDKLLERDCFNGLLSALREKYDIILVDTPPIGIIRDAEIMARDIDRTILVFCQDEVHASDINDSVELLEAAGTNVIGTIMNKRRVSIFERNSNSYGNYYYYYGYGNN